MEEQLSSSFKTSFQFFPPGSVEFTVICRLLCAVPITAKVGLWESLAKDIFLMANLLASGLKLHIFFEILVLFL